MVGMKRFFVLACIALLAATHEAPAAATAFDGFTASECLTIVRLLRESNASDAPLLFRRNLTDEETVLLLRYFSNPLSAMPAAVTIHETTRTYVTHPIVVRRVAAQTVVSSRGVTSNTRVSGYAK